MTIRVGVVMDPIAAINPKKDSTLAMMLAARRRGWQVFYMELKDLFLDQGEAFAAMTEVEVRDSLTDWYSLGQSRVAPLGELDVILMRKDPPVEREFWLATQILERAERHGVLVVNRPQSLRDCNEKLFATQFPHLCPPVLVSRDLERLRAFHQRHGDVVFKPVDGMGGQAVFRVREDDANLGVILETLTQHGQLQIMAQRYLPEIRDGDKRILLIDGNPVPYALARIPKQGENRGNLAAGGAGEGRPLTERDREICAEVGPVLREKGLIFVGIDVIGDYLTEINVTSPTCIRELDKAFGLDIADDLMAVIAARLGRG